MPNSQPPTAAVELRDVSKTYGVGAAAVSGVSLAINKGEFFTLLGPSGCGKTTTLRLIAGFEHPTSGEILIQANYMTNVPPHLRPVNTVFQNYALFPHLLVNENVAFGLSIKRVPKDEIQERVAAALQMVQMGHMMDRKPSELSGGQQQRVALARALVNRPEVLLLDEPLGALDLKLRKEMQIELKHMQRKLDITFVFVTHDQEEALTMSDRIAVMHRGEVLQVGTPSEIYEHPSTRFGADFIGEMNFIDVDIRSRQANVLDVANNSIALALPDITALPAKAKCASLAIRPEALTFTPPPAAEQEAWIAIEGRLSDFVYIGTDQRIVMTLDGGEQIIVRVQNSPYADAANLAIDDRCRVYCRREVIRVFETASPVSGD